jgi:hypothetical protein
MGHIDALNFDQLLPQCDAARVWPKFHSRSVVHFGARIFDSPRAIGVDYLKDDLFAFADDHGVEKCAHRLRVIAA